MEIGKDVGRKKKTLSRPIISILIVSILIIVSLFSFIFYMGQLNSTCSDMTPPKISANVVKENNSYLITITEAKEGSQRSVYHLYIKDFLRVSIVNGNQTLILRDLTAVLNNTSSNLTFYDMDGDDLLSAGDEFIVKGNLAVEGYELHILDAQIGELLKAIPLETTHEVTPGISSGGLGFGALYLLSILSFSLLIIFCFLHRNEKKAYRIVLYFSVAVLLLLLLTLFILWWIMIHSPVIY